MDPRQFRIHSQPDAALLAAAARPKVLEQAISAGERMQAQALVVALLQAQAMHRAKTIVPLDQSTDAEATDEVMASPASALEDQPTSSTVELPIELPTDYTQEILLEEVAEESQKLGALPEPYPPLAELPGQGNTPGITDLTQVSPLALTAELPAPAAPARKWWLVGLLVLLALSIAAILGVLVSWQVALAWLGVTAAGGLYLLARTRQKPFTPNSAAKLR